MSPCIQRSATGLCINRILKFPRGDRKKGRESPWRATAEMIFGGSEQLMKKLITFLSICTTVAILALPIAAHNFIAQPDNAIQDNCSTENKGKTYQTFLDNRKGDQEKAYKAA